MTEVAMKAFAMFLYCSKETPPLKELSMKPH